MINKIINVRNLILFFCLTCGSLILAIKTYAQDNIDTDGHTEIITLPENSEVTNIIEQYNALKFQQNYDIITEYILQIVEQYKSVRSIDSVILKPYYNSEGTKLYQCGDQPLSMVIDIDSTSQSNQRSDLQFNEMLNQTRAAGISIIWLSNQYDIQIKVTSKLQNSIFFKDSDQISFVKKGSKQLLRQSLSETHCIIAIIGDDKSDFDELFNYLRNPDQYIALNRFFEKGWFLRDLKIISSSQPTN